MLRGCYLRDAGLAKTTYRLATRSDQDLGGCASKQLCVRPSATGARTRYDRHPAHEINHGIKPKFEPVFGGDAAKPRPALGQSIGIRPALGRRPRRVRRH